MATEINKNKKWTNAIQIKKRRKQVKNSDDVSKLNLIVNQFITAVKNKHS